MKKIITILFLLMSGCQGAIGQTFRINNQMYEYAQFYEYDSTGLKLRFNAFMNLPDSSIGFEGDVSAAMRGFLRWMILNVHPDTTKIPFSNDLKFLSVNDVIGYWQGLRGKISKTRSDDFIFVANLIMNEAKNDYEK